MEMTVLMLWVIIVETLGLFVLPTEGLIVEVVGLVVTKIGLLDPPDGFLVITDFCVV